MKPRLLPAKDYAKAAGIGLVTGALLSAVMVSALKAGVSPLPAPLGLAFADRLFGAKLPLPAGLGFHLAWVTLWSVAYVALWRDRLSFGRALVLAAALAALVLLAFFPFVGWGLLGLAVSPKLIAVALASHLLFALLVWGQARLVFGAPAR